MPRRDPRKRTRLSERELLYLRAAFAPDEPTLEAVASELGVARSTVASAVVTAKRVAGRSTMLGLYQWCLREGYFDPPR